MTPDVAGKWYNQHGSELDLAVEWDGRIRGSFRSGIGFPDQDESFAVTGFGAGDLVGFVVSFGKYDSVTCWAGHVGTDNGEPILYTLWHMSVGLPPGAESELWQGVRSGSDTFVRRVPVRAHDERRARPSHPTPSGSIAVTT